MDEPTELSKSDYEALAAFRAALRRFLRFSEEGARAAGLTPQQHQLMLAVKGQRGKDWASITELAEALQIKHNAAVGLLDRCVQAGLVQREQDAHDRRLVRVYLTPQGEAVLARLSQQNLRELRSLQQFIRKPFVIDATSDDWP